jgi:uncharacterized membrane protein YoaK (UPF0700 family)
MRINRFIFTSVILSFVAGYADTSTFIGADGLFSAHVTGNFVVFAYDIITNQIAGSWLKLIAFPVFILAVFISSLTIHHLDDNRKAVNRLIIMEGFLLIAAGSISWFYRFENSAFLLKNLLPMFVVFALGLQNACGRFFPKEVLAPTTVMTGNVTQLVIDLTGYLKNKDQQKKEFKLKIAQEAMYVILPFLLGCISGGLITKTIGLGSTFFIGLLLLLLVRK